MSALLLGASLLLPVIGAAQDRPRSEMPRDSHSMPRYTDRGGHDTHDWNDEEDRYYRQYLNENRRKYRQFDRVNRRDQERYWRWRHTHSDMNRHSEGERH